MIDFPTLFPNLVKYLPNWMERFYPRIAQFARGEGYPCGNQGVFIPRRNRCWTHPKTGQKLKKPLTYQMYKDAKEKSQRSRTEKGRTALETREQSFRDKAREKVKGWQKNKESSQPDLDKLQKDLDSVKKLVENIAKASPDKVNSPRDNKVKRDYQKLLASQKQMEEAIQSKQKNKPQSEPKQTPNSTGESGKAIAVSTPDKKVEQKYKDIIASSKNPKGTEDAMSSALRNGVSDFDRENYNRYLSAIKSGTADKGVVGYYQDQIDRYKPVIDAENFINERRKKAIAGDYETKEEAGVFVLNKLKEKGYKEHEYYDSPDYKKDYDKLKSIMKSDKLPPPLSGVVPSKELKQTIKPGDKLFYKKDTYSLMSGGNSPTGYQIADAGEVLKVGVKNVKTKSKGEYMGKPYENEGLVPLDKISHIIRDGKRYKVDDSDGSPNDLGIPESSKSRVNKTEQGKTKSKNEVPYSNPLNYRDDPLDKFDKALDKEVEKLQQKTKTIPIETLKGKVDGLVSDYGNGLAVWKNKDNKKKEEVYTVVHTPSGKRLPAFDSIEEDQSKRIVAGLTALGVDWTKEEKEFTKNERLKDLNGLMRRVLDSNYRRFKIADKERLDKLRKARDEQDKKNDFNSHQILAQFGSGSLRRRKTKQSTCCCNSPNPLRRRKSKQTAKLRRGGNRYV